MSHTAGLCIAQTACDAPAQQQQQSSPNAEQRIQTPSWRQLSYPDQLHNWQHVEEQPAPRRLRLTVLLASSARGSAQNQEWGTHPGCMSNFGYGERFRGPKEVLPGDKLHIHSCLNSQLLLSLSTTRRVESLPGPAGPGAYDPKDPHGYEAHLHAGFVGSDRFTEGTPEGAPLPHLAAAS